MLSACASAPERNGAAGHAPLEEWITAQRAKSWQLLQLNISPSESKFPDGPKPRAGIVVAALHKKDPDYYFHWIRDSSNVMRVVIEHSRALGDDAQLHRRMDDFLALSRDLQALPSAFGMGEPRYTVEGQADTLPWSRPQFDGPALRALAVMQYLNDFELRAGRRALALQVLRTDLDFVKRTWPDRGFDIWEELLAENYHTRVVQLAALTQGETVLPGRGYAAAAKRLQTQLDQYWDPKKRYFRSQLTIERTDGYTKKNTDLDSAVLVAVMESGRMQGPHSVTDPHVHATVAALEDLFRQEYPLNRDPGLGLGYGRYKGDVYFGGNPWPLITAYYAQFYYRLAIAIQDGLPVTRTAENQNFLDALAPGSSDDLMAACVKKGDRILARLQRMTGADGQMYEQADKATGAPLSSRGIGWAHSAYLAAVLERSRAITKTVTR